MSDEKDWRNSRAHSRGTVKSTRIDNPVSWDRRQRLALVFRHAMEADFCPERPRLILAFILSIAAGALFCWPSWPGFMSFDSLFAYAESIDGVNTAVWPPMHAYLFYMSRHLGAGVAGVFLGQTVLLFFGAAMLLTMFVKRTGAVLASFAGFAAIFVIFPTMWGTLAVIWKDVTTTSFAMLGIALWLIAIQRRSYIVLTGAILALSLGVALRYNAVPLTIFIFFGIVACPFGGVRRPFGSAIAGCLTVAGLALAFASTVYRLPDLQNLPSARGFAGVQEFDLIGISVCSEHNYLPLGMSSGQPISVAQIGQLYDPRHVQLAFQVKPGIPALIETDAGGAVPTAWLQVVPKEFGCYLHHRFVVFKQQLGLTEQSVFYPTHGGIDLNPYGIKLARPAAAQALTGYIVQASNSPWRRPWILYALALIITTGSTVWGGPGRMLRIAMLLGALAYPATLFFVGPAADARYIFPPNVFCAMLIILGLVSLSNRRSRVTTLGIQSVTHLLTSA